MPEPIEPEPTGSSGFFTPNNNCNCQLCESCIKNEISSDECELIVNQKHVTKIIWEIVSISDPWERFISPSLGSYISVPGTTALIGEYIVDLTTPNAPTLSPTGCQARYVSGDIVAATGVYYRPDADPEDIPGNLRVVFTSIGSEAGFFQSILEPIYDVEVLTLGAIDLCLEVPLTTYQLGAPVDRGSTTVWRMRHGFD